MRKLAAFAGRKTFAATAACLLIVGAAQVAFAAAPAKPNASVQADDDQGPDEPEDEATSAPAAQHAAPAAPQAATASEALTRDDVVGATREGLRRSAIGSGIRKLRMLDYFLLSGVGLAVLLSLVSLGLLLGIRKRLGLGPANATVQPRDLSRQEEQLYETKPLP